jgi:hypothetical protein
VLEVLGSKHERLWERGGRTRSKRLAEV